MKIFRTGAHETFYDMPLFVVWCLTKRCNYRCSYCFHYGKGKTTPPQLPFFTLEKARAAVDNIASLNRPWYNVQLAGGEPTIHPHFFDIISLLHEKLGERLNYVQVISNGSRNEKLYHKLAEISKSICLDMLISIHTDHVDMAHILELIENLSNKMNLRFSLMFNPDKREEVHLIYDIMYEYRKRFSFNMGIAQIVDETNHLDSRYTQEDFAWRKVAADKFKKLTESLKSKALTPKHSMRIFYDFEDGCQRTVSENHNYQQSLLNGDMLKFKDMYCIAHSAVLYIEEDGFCNGMVCSADPYICNIYEEGSLKAARKDLIHAIVCPIDLCHCGCNNCIPKFSSRLEAARFIEVFDAKQQALFDAAQ